MRKIQNSKKVRKLINNFCQLLKRISLIKRVKIQLEILRMNIAKKSFRVRIVS